MHWTPGLARGLACSIKLKTWHGLVWKIVFKLWIFKEKKKGNLGNLLSFTVVMNTSCVRAFTCCASHNNQAVKYVENTNYDTNRHMQVSSIAYTSTTRSTRDACGPRPYFQFVSYKLHNNLGGFVYHSLFFHVRPADQTTIMYVPLGIKQVGRPFSWQFMDNKEFN